MFPILNIGSLAIRTPELFLLAGIFIGLTLAEHFARRRGENPDLLSNLVLLAGASGLVMARVGYAVEHWALFRGNLAGLIALDPALLDPWSGVAGGVIAALIYGTRQKMAFWAVLDGLAPFLAVMAVFIGGAHIASGAAFGAPTDLPWAVDLWGAWRHPSQVYETLGALAILLALWKTFGTAGGSGTTFLKFTALSAGMMVFLAAFRGDSRIIMGPLRLEQVFALVVLGLALLVLEIRQVRQAGGEKSAAG